MISDLWLSFLAIFGIILSGFLFYYKGFNDGKEEVRQEVIKSIFELISDIEDEERDGKS